MLLKKDDIEQYKTDIEDTHAFINHLLILNHLKVAIMFRDDGVGFTYDPGKTGLGLANVESRVESVNGNMKFESRTSGETGSSYTINLPLN